MTAALKIEPISISTEAASKATGIPPSTLRTMAKAGKVPGARKLTDKRYVFIVADLRNWIVNHPAPGAAN